MTPVRDLPRCTTACCRFASNFGTDDAGEIATPLEYLPCKAVLWVRAGRHDMGLASRGDGWLLGESKPELAGDVPAALSHAVVVETFNG